VYHLLLSLIPNVKRTSDRTGQTSRWSSIAGLIVIAIVFFTSACATIAPVPLPTPTAPHGSSRNAPASEAPVMVVATITILADLTRSVGGDLVQVTTIVPPGADEHSFQTTPLDSVAISQAKVIVSNGFGLDGFLQPLLESSMPASAVHVVAAEGLEAQHFNEAESLADAPEDEHERAAGNPHFWQDPILTIHYVERIRNGLTQADPANSEVYAANAQAYIQQLRELDQEIARLLEQVPPERRHLVTFHDAFGYFAARYGWKASAFAPSDASEVTPGAIVSVMRQIRNEGIPAVFAEPQFSSGVLEGAAQDAGIRVGTIRSLPDDEAPTYIDMMRSNAKTLMEHLADEGRKTEDG
jgi:manganese/iron transport system substrate-binding protein